MSLFAPALVTVRLAGVNDAALLAELGERTFSETFAADNRPEDMAAYLAEAFGPSIQRAELADSEATFFIAEAEGLAAGYAELYAGSTPVCVVGERLLELARLYVSRELLGRGVGAALMDRCISEAHATGRDTMWLGVWEHNLRAQAFYRKRGFRVVGSQPFQLGSDEQIDFVMALTLP